MVNEDKFEKHLDQILKKANSFLCKNSTNFYFPDDEDFYQFLRIKFWKLFSDGKYNLELSDKELSSFQWKFVRLRAIDFLRSITKKTDRHNTSAVSWELLENNQIEDLPEDDEE